MPKVKNIKTSKHKSQHRSSLSLKENLSHNPKQAKRNEGRAEIIERKRREYLVRNSHNKMYLYNKQHLNKEIQHQSLHGTQIKIMSKSNSKEALNKSHEKRPVNLDYKKITESAINQIPVLFKSISQLKPQFQNPPAQKMKDMDLNKEKNNISLYLEAPILKLQEVERSSSTSQKEEKEFEVDDEVEVKHIKKKEEKSILDNGGINEACGPSPKNQILPNKDLFVSSDKQKSSERDSIKNNEKSKDYSPRMKKHVSNLPIKSFEMDCSPLSQKKMMKNVKLSPLHSRGSFNAPTNSSKGFLNKNKEALKPIKMRTLLEGETESPSIKYRSSYKSRKDDGVMYKTIQDKYFGEDSYDNYFDLSKLGKIGLQNNHMNPKFESEIRLSKINDKSQQERKLNIELKGTSFKSRFKPISPSSKLQKDKPKAVVTKKEIKPSKVEKKEEIINHKKNVPQRSPKLSQINENITPIDNESHVHTLYSPVQTRKGFKQKLCDVSKKMNPIVTPITNIQYPAQESLSQDEDSFSDHIYQTKVKIKRKSPRKSKSINLSINNSKDSAAFNLVCLQLSSEGKTYEEMQKKMIKQQRLNKILQRSIQKKQEMIESRYKLAAQPNDQIEKLFNKLHQNSSDSLPEDSNLMNEIKNWANYSLDPPQVKPQNSQIASRKQKYLKSQSLIKNMNRYKEDYFVEKIDEEDSTSQNPKRKVHHSFVRTRTFKPENYSVSIGNIDEIQRSIQYERLKSLQKHKDRYPIKRGKFFHMNTIEQNMKVLNNILPSQHSDI
ncbi:unnamed protein product [Moneuplotes crassus]|uniref:Uncharacterized protein n=1 Tax=Euplotes crassus TaxID=5936 RepID=A0AAD1XS12_EUPCR|nr:unnamed protein product [Moneuplotes crassus]